MIGIGGAIFVYWTAFAAGDDPVDAGKVDLQKVKQRGCVKKIEFGRNLEQLGDAIGVLGHADADAEPNVGVAGSPVVGKSGGDKMRTFGKKLKYEVWALANNIPGFRSPGVRIGKEEVAPGADENKGAFKGGQW